MGFVVTPAISILLVLAFAWFGGTSYLGAHPVAWPFQVAVIGAPIGAVIALGVGMILPSKTVRVILFIVFALAGWALAHYGKLGFTASYAEDRLAGKFWYFGWIATCAATTAALTAIASR